MMLERVGIGPVTRAILPQDAQKIAMICSGELSMSSLRGPLEGFLSLVSSFEEMVALGIAPTHYQGHRELALYEFRNSGNHNGGGNHHPKYYLGALSASMREIRKVGIKMPVFQVDTGGESVESILPGFMRKTFGRPNGNTTFALTLERAISTPFLLARINH